MPFNYVHTLELWSAGRSASRHVLWSCVNMIKSKTVRLIDYLVAVRPTFAIQELDFRNFGNLLLPA